MLCSLNQGKQYKFLIIYTYITYIYIISHRHEGHWATAHRSTLLGKLHVFGSKGRERIRPGSRVGPRAEPELAMLGKHHMATRDCRGRWMRPGLWPNQSRCTWLSLRLQRTPALGWKPHPGAHPHRRPHGSPTGRGLGRAWIQNCPGTASHGPEDASRTSRLSALAVLR